MNTTEALKLRDGWREMAAKRHRDADRCREEAMSHDSFADALELAADELSDLIEAIKQQPRPAK